MASDEDDDYMNMTFGEEEVPKGVETSLQRRQRLKREGEIKGRVKSKAELAAEENAAREAALSQSMLEGARAGKSKGLAMMAKMGFKKGGALGSNNNNNSGSGSGANSVDALHARIVEPLRPEIKDGRAGIGLDSDRKRKLRDAAEAAEKKVKVDENEFRERVRREREEARCERQVYAAMKVCERMDEEEEEEEEASSVGTGGGDSATGEAPGGGKKRTLSTRPLKSIPVVWRGLVRRREEAERDRRMKHDIQQSSTPVTARLPAYDDDLEDEDDKMAAGKTQVAHALVEDLDEEDPELDEFDALEADDRLRRLVEYLRKEYRYCFWCKFEYPDESMEGCPGLVEEDHD